MLWRCQGGLATIPPVRWQSFQQTSNTPPFTGQSCFSWREGESEGGKEAQRSQGSEKNKLNWSRSRRPHTEGERLACSGPRWFFIVIAQASGYIYIYTHMKDTRERWMLRHMENGTKIHTHDDHSTALWPDRAQGLIALSVARLHLLPVAAQMKAAICVFLKQFGHTHKRTFRPLVACVPRPLSLMSQQQKQNPVTSTSEACAIRLETCLHTSQLSPSVYPHNPPPPPPSPSHSLNAAPPDKDEPLSFSRLRRPHWWLPGIHSFSGTWTKSCAADPAICAPEVGRPRAEAGGPGASSAPGRGPRIHLGPRPALLLLLLLLLLRLLLPLRLHLLCSPSSARVECVHWGGQRGNNKHKGPVYSL